MSETENATVKRSFFRNVKSEFKKIVWPKKDDLIKQTGLVVVISVLLGIVIAGIDMAIKYGMDRVFGA
ncbi:MAG: preprotein translocase subunit SecE [Lachnoclostridium sp.]|jgi:preprotein translocase subunit SecE|nr:preprotein translocase subunit SecE [Lachnoclostridium sp.]